jgi:tetratricopeptide (TPR) repeat protein/transcriptional regulator with XRE-family HTH domain
MERLRMASNEAGDTVSFGAALRQARHSAGLSLADLARHGHYSKGYLSRIESGERRPTSQLAARCDEVLGADGALAALVPAAGPAGQASTTGLIGSVRPLQLPPPPTLFTGRQRELDRLDVRLSQLGSAALVAVISGMGGVGKTALALAWAHRASRHFPDGVLFADLCGFGPTRLPASSQDVQAGFLRALGVPVGLIPRSAAQVTGLYRSGLHDRRMLMVLDNVADARQVRPLLPGSPSAAVLITSRSRLTGLCARDGAIPIPLEPLSPEDSYALVAAILSGASEGTLRQITEACGRLPLALRLAAHRLAARQHASAATGMRDMADQSVGLDLLRNPGDQQADLRAVMRWSYDALPAVGQQAIGLFARYAGADLTGPVAAVLMDTDVPAAGRMLNDLVDVHLLTEIAPGRFRFHDLFRLYAAELAGPDPDALRRLGNWYLVQVRAAAAVIAPQMLRLSWQAKGMGHPVRAIAMPELADSEAAFNFMHAERRNLLAVMELCAAHDFGQISWLLADAARGYYYHTRYLRDWVQATQTGLRLARQHGDQTAIAGMLASRALSAWAAGDFQRAIELNQEALPYATDDDWAEGIAMITSNLGMAWFNQGQLEQARDAYAMALSTNRAIGNRHAQAVQLGNLAGVHHEMGEVTEALRCYGEALAIYSSAGALESVALMRANQANVYLTLGDPGSALAAATSALDICQARGSRLGQCRAEFALAKALRASGDAVTALEAAQRAHSHAQAIGDRRLEVDALNLLGELAAEASKFAKARNYLDTAHQIAVAIAYGPGIRDARRALKELDSAITAQRAT